MLPPTRFTRDDNGGLPVWSLTVLSLLILSALFLRPLPERQSTLSEGLGPEVRVEKL